MGELVREKGELREAAHGEQALEDEGPSRMGGRGEIGPDSIDSFSFLYWECIECLRADQHGKVVRGRATRVRIDIPWLYPPRTKVRRIPKPSSMILSHIRTDAVTRPPKPEERLTCCSFKFVPSSAILWCRTHSFLAGGWM